MQQLGSTALFAAKFRESGERARCCCRDVARTGELRCGSRGSARMIC